MGNEREPKETKLDRLKADLVRAKEKASEWQARVRDIERQITEQENIEIVQAVRGMISEPEDLRAVLNMIRAMNESPAANFGKENESL